MATQNDQAYKTAYDRLNTEQRKAVDTIEGPVMVIAGPGTGKTQILTLRIANILKVTDTAPEQILALTFTDAGAQAMRERLRQYIGSEAYRVHISTFHGFAQRLISEYPDAYPRIIGGRPASELEKVSIIETILTDASLKTLRPSGNPGYYVKPLIHTISDLKRENISPEKLNELNNSSERALLEIERFHTKGAHKGKQRGEYTDKEKAIEKNKALLTVYRRYEALLTEQNLFDFDDMIMETVTALENNIDMLRDLQERHQYLLADEHQDVNGAQNKIIELLSNFHDSPNVFVVGDEKQAIFRFQGASLENFLAFEKQNNAVTTISLTKNYRSGQNILDAAQDLITVDDKQLMELRVPLTAEVVTESQVTNRKFTHQAVEDDWVVSAIKKELEEGTVAEQIAVIVRNNEEVESLAALLRRAGVPVRASADSDVLLHPITQFVKSLLSIVTDAADMRALFTVLHGGFWGFTTTDLARVLSQQRFDLPLATIISDEAIVAQSGVSAPESFLRIAKLIEEARSRQSHEAPHRVMEFLLEESGYLEHIIKNDPYEGTRVVRRLYDEIEELVVSGRVHSLRDVALQLKVHEQYNLPLNAPYIVTDTQSVAVLTAHKSKGLEYEVVFMPHTVESRWGGKNRSALFKIQLSKYADIHEHSALEDERRLMYVAMTRAKYRLHVSESETSREGKELIAARLKTEIQPERISEMNIDEFEESFSPVANLSIEKVRSILDPAIFKTILTERGFSATSLNNFITSPWNFLYRNILRIPELQAEHMQFGTAVHNTIEAMTKTHMTSGALPNMTRVKEMLELQLNRLPLSAHAHATLLEKGLEMLVVYSEHLARTLPAKTREELKIRVLLETGIPELPEVLLTGKLDRVDFHEDGTVSRVVDYKTGKPKSRNYIEGKTQDSDGGYKRQLVFYSLLLELHDDERYKTRNGVLSFVEPTVKGEIKEETFVITDDEIDALKTEIIEAVKKLLDGTAFSEMCDPTKSDYCDLATSLIR